MGAIDPDSGTYVFDGGDPRAPMPSVLNLLALSVRTAFITIKQRVKSLEDRFAAMDTATAWADLPLNGANFEKANLDSIGSVAAKPVQFRRLGSKFYLEGAGNTTVVPGNWAVFGTLPVGSRPSEPTPFLYIFSHSSSACRGIIETSGIVRLGQAPPSVGTDVTIIAAEGFLA